MTSVEVFRLDGTDTSISLQYRLALYQLRLVPIADSSLSVFICISQRIVTSSSSSSSYYYYWHYH